MTYPRTLFCFLLISLFLGHATLAHSEEIKSPAQDNGRVCDVKFYGAKADGRTLDTRAIQSAIDTCTKDGGGTVKFADGVFLSGTIKLKSGIDLRIEPTATVRAVQEVLQDGQDGANYPYLSPPTDNSQLHNCRRALIYGLGLANISISGGGTIDGGGTFDRWKGKGVPENIRPMPIFIVQSKDVSIHDINVVHAAMWSIVNMENDNVKVQHVMVNSPDGPTRDGIDTIDSHHVVIRDSEITSQDDSLCLKSGTAKGVSDVTVQNVHILKSSVANGLKLGTASKGPFDHILFDNVIIENVKQGAMDIESVDGADIKDVTFRNIRFHKAAAAVYVVLGRRGKTAKIGSIDGVLFENIDGDTDSPWGSAITGNQLGGAADYIRNIAFNHVHVKARGNAGSSAPSSPPEYRGEYPDPDTWGDLPASGFFFRHVDGLRLEDVKVQADPPDSRKSVVFEDVKGREK